MPNLELPTAMPTNANDTDECVLLIEAMPDDAARILDQLGSAADERYRVEWVSELSSGIERLRSGGVGSVAVSYTHLDVYKRQSLRR